MTPKKIGIFAGSFDPIHVGHVEVARQSLHWLGLDEVYFMVEGKPWGQKDPASLAARQEMVNLALAPHDRLLQLELPSERFTIKKTLPWIEKMFGTAELYFILGADVFIHMNEKQWPDLPLLLSHNIVVFERGFLSEKEIADHARQLGIACAILPSPHPKHSSTAVRTSIEGRELLVSTEVASYIDKKQLYSIEK